MVPHSVLRQYGFRITNTLFQILRSFRSKANKLVIYQLLCPFFTTKHQQIFSVLTWIVHWWLHFLFHCYIFEVPIRSYSISAKGLSDTPHIRSPGIPYLVSMYLLCSIPSSTFQEPIGFQSNWYHTLHEIYAKYGQPLVKSLLHLNWHWYQERDRIYEMCASGSHLPPYLMAVNLTMFIPYILLGSFPDLVMY